MLKIHPANLSQSALDARRKKQKQPDDHSSAKANKPKAHKLPESHVPVGSLGVPVVVRAAPSEKLRILVPAEEAMRRRERARSRGRAKRARRRVLTAIALAVIAASFFAGFGFVKFRAFASRATHPGDAETPPNAQAMELLDRAVQAKSEERYDDAVRLAAQARGADPNLRGVDVLVAELAMKQQRPDIVEQASRSALKRGHDLATANLLLALNAWKLRAQPGAVADPAQSAMRQTAEVCADAPFEGDAYFFLGEMHRTLGQLALSHANFLSALHRMAPWSSSSILKAKMQQVAASAAVDQGVANVANEEPADLRSSLTAWQFRVLEGEKTGINPSAPRKTLLDAQRTSPVQIRDAQQLPATGDAVAQ